METQANGNVQENEGSAGGEVEEVAGREGEETRATAATENVANGILPVQQGILLVHTSSLQRPP
jgi:hypothetical protein